MRRRWLLLGLAALLLLALGLALGRQTAEPQARPAVTVTVRQLERDEPEREGESPQTSQTGGYARTPEGAAAAARAYLAALAGRTLVDPGAARSTLIAIASTAARDGLVRAYELAAAQTREQLGLDSAESELVLRTASVGYRMDGFHPEAATVSIWRLGVVGAGSTVEPRQSWRTETVSLVWEDGTWKLDAVRSSPGPTPPLAGPAPTRADELAAAIRRFEPFADETP